MNFHSDSWIFQQLYDHRDEAGQYFDKNHTVGIFVQGSQNYGLDYENSDVDTKLIVTPYLDDLVFNKQPVSTTHLRKNNEHIDFKDIRLYFQTFVKQNLNFLEILFTPYFIINDDFLIDWNKLIENRELIARMNPYTAVKSMQGIAHNKMHALKHRFEGKIDVIDKYGYDPKQLHHIKRVEEYLERYIAGEPYIDCLNSNRRAFLIGLKQGFYSEAMAIKIAEEAIEHIDKLADEFCEKTKPIVNKDAVELLNSVQANIVKKSLIMELNK